MRALHGTLTFVHGGGKNTEVALRINMRVGVKLGKLIRQKTIKRTLDSTICCKSPSGSKPRYDSHMRTAHSSVSPSSVSISRFCSRDRALDGSSNAGSMCCVVTEGSSVVSPHIPHIKVKRFSGRKCRVISFQHATKMRAEWLTTMRFSRKHSLMKTCFLRSKKTVFLFQWIHDPVLVFRESMLARNPNTLSRAYLSRIKKRKKSMSHVLVSMS